MAAPTYIVPGSNGAVSGQVHCGLEPRPSQTLSCEQSEEGKANTRLFCSLCKIAVNSVSQLEEHSRGSKHKTILEASIGLGPIKAYPRLCFSSSLCRNAQERTFHCEICNIRVNSEPQLKQHISSRKHRDAAAGKSNPLLNQHKSLSSAELTDPSKTSTYGLLPSPVAVAAMMSTSSSSQLAHHTFRPVPHSYLPIIHTTQLSYTVLQPAVRSIYSSHRRVLFSPY